MARKLFSQISPTTYAISVWKGRAFRHARDLISGTKYAKTKAAPLPISVYKHSSLIRRKLGNVDMQLQENKAVNLTLTTPQIDGVLIRPGETFSFWKLAGKLTKERGYLPGLTISSGVVSSGTGGGMCQFTNLLHWLCLHSALDIIEHHHHDGMDLFPDFGRQVPFGVGTSIFYNYIDYRVKNNTADTFQFRMYTTETHLCGELLTSTEQEFSYHIAEAERHFERRDGKLFRRGKIYRHTVDKRTGNTVKSELIRENNARVMYSEEYVDPELIV